MTVTVPHAKFTDEQAEALAAHERSVALAAGAGCGKTFVLTERFLSYLDPRQLQPTAELDELVAITFTDAAAREMRDRVRRSCYERLSQASDPEEQQAWRRLLRILDSARISTIHSFCGALLRNHAVEAHLDPRFEQLDAASADLLRLRTLDDRLRQLLLERDEAVIQLATRFGLEKLREYLLNLVGENLSEVYEGWHDSTPAKLIATWREYYHQETFPQAAREILASEPVQQLQTICVKGDFAADELHAHCGRILVLLQELPDSDDPVRLLEELIQLARVQGNAAKKKNWASEEDFNSFRDTCKKVRDDIIKKSILFKPWNEEQLQDTAQAGLELLKLSADVAHCYEQAKQDRNVLDYDDLMQKAHRMLTAPEYALQQRELAKSTKLLLVDEFQDTDPVQVAIVKALCGQQWAEQGLFVVGDAKQSIYRFRGAQPIVSQQLGESLPEGSRLSLTTNFRSQGAILDFVNALFFDAFEEAYKPLRPSRPQLTPTPSVEFLWAPTDAGHDDSIPAQLRGVQRERYREARFIARRLAEMIDSGQALVVQRENNKDSLRPVRQGDVAILLRALSDVQVYEEALREQGLDYYLAGGHAFYAQQEIFDILHLLRCVCSEADELSLAGAMRSPIFAVEDETLYWLATKCGSLHAGLTAKELPHEISLQEHAKVVHARTTLEVLRSRKDNLLVAELLGLAIELTGYDAVLRSEFLGERKLANLHKLVEQARTLDKLSPGDLAGFVTQLTQFVTRDPKEPAASTTAEGDVIRIMTIHNAKGLEFPVVVIPDLERQQRGGSSVPVFDLRLGPLVSSTDDSCVGRDLHQLAEQFEDNAERLRLLYVACTRAADYLFLSSSVKDLDKPKSDWLKFLAKRFDISTGNCLAELPADFGVPEIRVTNSEPTSGRKPASRARGADLIKLVDKTFKLAESGGGMIPPGVAPISVDLKARKSFSFSRLSGKLHKRLIQSQSLDDELELATPLLDPRGFGTLVHEVLEQITENRNSVSFSDVKDLCDFLAPNHLEFNAEEGASEAIELVSRFLQSPRYKSMTEARCLLREVEFLLPGQLLSDSLTGRYLEGIIDCLYQDNGGEWHLLDYKTNNVSAADVPAAARSYAIQMFVYGMACEKALGVQPVESTLYFLRPPAESQWRQSEANQADLIREVLQAVEALDSEVEG
ncbi:UvrD-helicase domain-containing protein [Bythopirellula polymerisocia]|uniref:DNA 3'-5' helicase n=1 Tax=Bythopirellula polymerisocia TaxID=2528003 RepID=A0A5C6CR22_9BACT|nr:UvrD-helicase domain-containing protein [Bythopirellula polymerisocia]TWU25987.1 ATP-dependent helicase/nuclease subunit A [Bythopirellula polymerisocia]